MLAQIQDFSRENITRGRMCYIHSVLFVIALFGNSYGEAWTWTNLLIWFMLLFQTVDERIEVYKLLGHFNMMTFFTDLLSIILYGSGRSFLSLVSLLAVILICITKVFFCVTCMIILKENGHDISEPLMAGGFAYSDIDNPNQEPKVNNSSQGISSSSSSRSFQSSEIS